MENTRYCLLCAKPISRFNSPKKLYCGEREAKNSCIRKIRREQDRKRFAESIEKRKKRVEASKAWRKTHKVDRKEYQKKWKELHYKPVPGGMRSEARKRAARENLKKAMAARKLRTPPLTRTTIS